LSSPPAISWATTAELVLTPCTTPARISSAIRVVTLNLMIGLSTPPYGEAAFIISRVTNTPLGAVFRDLIRYILFMILALFLIGAFPDIVLWIPRLAGYRG
jgi:TRAP-type C4-dicarboxylate transport system permease large subunit